MRILLLILSFLTLVGCFNHQLKKPSDLGIYNLNYSVDERDSLGVIAAFDNGKETYIHLKPKVTEQITVSSDSNAENFLTYERAGDYLIVPGVFDSLIVSTKKKHCVIHNVSSFSELPASVGAQRDV